MKKFDYIIGGIALCAFLVLIVENSASFIPYRYLIQKINFVIFSLFAIDILIKFFSSKDKRRHITHHWFDLIVFIPLIQFIYGIESTNFFTIIRQIVIVAILISRVKKSNTFINLLSLKPAQLMIAGFAMAIGTGAVLLMLPISVFGGERISLIDALFTATSATCVTGLIVKDTGTYFSYFGQMVILSLIQLGGLGIMTFSISLTLLLRKRVEMKQQVVMRPKIQSLFQVEQEEVTFDAVEKQEGNNTFMALFQAAVVKEKVPKEGTCYLQLPTQGLKRKISFKIVPLKDKKENVSLALIFVNETLETAKG